MGSALQIVLLAYVVGQLGRVPLMSAGSKDAPLLLNDLLVLGLLALATLVALRRRSLVLDGPAVFALAFAAVGAVSAALAIPRLGLTPFQFVFSIAYLARWLAYFGVYLVVINFVTRDDLRPLWGTITFAVLVFAGFGIVQSAVLPDFAQIVYPEAELYAEWDPQGHRLVSTFLDPNFAGALIAMTLLVQLARLTYGLRVSRWQLGVLFTALVLTLSRSSALAFAFGSLVVVAARGLSRRVVRLTAALALLMIPLIPYLVDFAVRYNKLSLDDPSMLGRFVAWARAIQVLIDHPVLGVGFNTYGFVQDALYGFDQVAASAFGLDGGLLFIAVMTGIVGLLLYLAMIGLVLRRCRALWRDDARPASDRAFAVGTAAATVALVMHSLFLNSLLYPFLMEILWVLWGMTHVLERPPRPRRARVVPARRAALAGAT